MSTELEQQLVRVQNELDALRVEFSNYAYTVSHDLAAPFRHIDGFANIILSKYEDQFDDKTSGHFDIILKAAEKGTRIIEALLEYSQLCTETVQASRVDCNVLVADVLAQLSELIQETNAEVSCAEMPVIEGDDKQISKLFYHLIHNALHYQKPGTHPIVAINVMKVENEWEFCIEDNGIGIADKQVDKVFLVLKRAVAENDYLGSGMGLAIAKYVVQHHGGKIWVQSTADSGCSLHFTLPVDRGSN